MERRLAAILLTDMVGYSQLMGLDEEGKGTIARQKAHREEIIGPKISGHGGRIVKTTGDGVLVEFPSVVDAVKCAVEVHFRSSTLAELEPIKQPLWQAMRKDRSAGGQNEDGP